MPRKTAARSTAARAVCAGFNEAAARCHGKPPRIVVTDGSVTPSLQ